MTTLVITNTAFASRSVRRSPRVDRVMVPQLPASSDVGHWAGTVCGAALALVPFSALVALFVTF